MKKQLLTVFTFFSLLFTTCVFAQSITLYDQPGDKGKDIGKIDLSTGIMQIYKPAPGDWIKVADPHNGNVGWVKAKDMDTVNNARTYQIIQYGKRNKMSDEQIAAMVKQMRDQQETMQKAFQNMFNTMNQMFQEEWRRLGDEGMFPLMMPVVVSPAEKAPVPATTNHHPAKAATQSTTAPNK